ncbi:MAG: serine/threonine protein kinase [Phycisphaerales bacterium]|nr:MAG: serine/threonine protein kinase [Phycisphaerales bacterium]
MVVERRCPECNAPLYQDAPEDLCPACLMRIVAQRGGNAETNDAALVEGLGTMIGRYTLIKLIGEGGMGLVYLAEQQEPVKRRVALKIIKPGMDSKQVIARFEAERQALALLHHFSIARVFDGGTTEDGLPYFVMDYVKGLPITDYCDRHKLNVEQRLILFRQVCEAVHHAHQKGIIHRDLKPSNILVTVDGDRAIPVIIDFGVAKALSQPLTDRTLVTEQGQFIGTLEYMSPEQADPANQDIDVRSDVYALGVVLYELLTGVLPFESQELRAGGFEGVRRMIAEQEPRTPSVRLTNLGPAAAKIARARGTNVAALARRLGRELEWIPLKAMRKERARRYRSAAEFADDIQNYLNGSPLSAGPESTVYHMRKFVRKHHLSVAVVLALISGLAIGLAVTLAMYISMQRMLDTIFGQ